MASRNLAIAVAQKLLTKPHIGDVRKRIEAQAAVAFDTKDKASYDELRPLALELAALEKKLNETPAPVESKPQQQTPAKK